MLKIALAAAFVAAALPAPVLAQDSLPDVRVYYGDLDLADPAAVRTFDRRLANAVDAACPSDAGLREVDRLQAIKACRTNKLASVAALRQSALAAANIDKNVLASAR